MLDEYNSDDDSIIGSKAIPGAPKREGLSATSINLMEKLVFLLQKGLGVVGLKNHRNF